MSNPFLDRLAKEPKNSHGKKYERKGAASLAAQLTPASGAMVGAKGDMLRKGKKKGDGWLMEVKTTTAASLALQLSWLVKISSEALSRGEKPAVLVAFVTPEGQPKPSCESQWVMMPLQVYKELTEDL
jgi:hypothetical protein